MNKAIIILSLCSSFSLFLLYLFSLSLAFLLLPLYLSGLVSRENM